MKNKKTIAIVLMILGALIYPLTLLYKHFTKKDGEETTGASNGLENMFNTAMKTGLTQTVAQFLLANSEMYSQSATMANNANLIVFPIRDGEKTKLFSNALSLSTKSDKQRKLIAIWYITGHSRDMLEDLRVNLTKEQFNQVYQKSQWTK